MPIMVRAIAAQKIIGHMLASGAITTMSLMSSVLAACEIRGNILCQIGELASKAALNNFNFLAAFEKTMKSGDIFFVSSEGDFVDG